ncbi:Vacuolar fusion protein mon1 [Balamuthia mandrillaris]
MEETEVDPSSSSSAPPLHPHQTQETSSSSSSPPPLTNGITATTAEAQEKEEEEDESSSATATTSKQQMKEKQKAEEEVEEEEEGEEGRSSSSSTTRTVVEDEDELDVYYQQHWPKHKKHIFILSSAGKPIYARYGDEQKICGFMGVIQAICSTVASSGDTLHYLVAGDHKFVFVVKEPFIYVTVSQTGEPVMHLRRQLEYVHSQIISTLTAGVTKIFQTRAHFDIRGLLTGTEKFLDNLIRLMETEASFIVDSVQCLRLPQSVRSFIATVLQSIQTEDLAYAVLISNHKLVNFMQPRRHLLHPEDLQLIFNFINSSTSFRNSESWTPLCLPKFNDKGYLHAYVCYLMEDLCLLLISINNELFFRLSESKRVIDKGLSAGGAMDAIAKSFREPPYTLRDIPIALSPSSSSSPPSLQHTGLIHFLFKQHDPQRQFTAPEFLPPYNNPLHRERLLRLYQLIQSKMHKQKAPKPAGKAATTATTDEEHSSNLKMWFSGGTKETLLSFWNSDYELYTIFEPLVSKTMCMRVCGVLLKWIKREESYLFVQNPSDNVW